MSPLQPTGGSTRLVDALCGTRCPGCGGRGEAPPCASCLSSLLVLDAATHAIWADTGSAHRLVRAAKFGHWRTGGRELARHAVRHLPRERFDVVTWVPADRRRRAARGGHLPEAVARTWARELGVPAIGLLRRRSRRTQQGLSREQRAENVRDAWELQPRHGPEGLPGLRVLLVDDLRTTGATLDAAGLALRDAGAVVHPMALVAREALRGSHPRGVAVDAIAACGKRAHCEEFALTHAPLPADGQQHER